MQGRDRGPAFLLRAVGVHAFHQKIQSNSDLPGNLLYWRGSAHAFPFGEGAPPSLQRGSCGAEEVRQALAQLHAFRQMPTAPLPTSLALGHPPQRGGLYPDKSNFENRHPYQVSAVTLRQGGSLRSFILHFALSPTIYRVQRKNLPQQLGNLNFPSGNCVSFLLNCRIFRIFIP